MSHPHAHSVRLLLARLERVSADSFWAHRASGARGALLRELEKLEAGAPIDEGSLRRALEGGFQVLQNAARERSK